MISRDKVRPHFHKRAVAALQVLYRAVNYQMEPEEPKSEADGADQAKVCASSPFSLVVVVVAPPPLLPCPAPCFTPPTAAFHWP